MSPKSPWKDNPENPTRVETLSDADLAEEARKGDKDARVEFQAREFRRREGLPELYYKIVTKASDGKDQVAFVLAPYYRRRQSFLGRAWIVGATAASVMTVMAAIYAVCGPVSGWRIICEVIADVLIIAGTFFTARGAFLGISGSSWVQELACQHGRTLNQQINPRQSDDTRQLMLTIDGIKGELVQHGDIIKALEAVREKLSQNLRTSTSGFSDLQVLTNRDIAELFLDASSGAVLGSILIIGGTLMLAILAQHGGQ
jgi:hypothetical protein